MLTKFLFRFDYDASEMSPIKHIAYKLPPPEAKLFVMVIELVAAAVMLMSGAVPTLVRCIAPAEVDDRRNIAIASELLIVANIAIRLLLLTCNVILLFADKLNPFRFLTLLLFSL